MISDKKIFKVFLLFAMVTTIPHRFQIFEHLSVSPKGESCETWLKLAQWFRRRYHLKKLLTEATATDRQRVITKAPLQPLAQVSVKQIPVEKSEKLFI